MDTEDISKDKYEGIVKPLLLKVFNNSIFTFGKDIVYPFSDSIQAFLFIERYANEELDSQAFWNVIRDEILNLGDTFVYRVDTMSEFCYSRKLKKDKDCELEHGSCVAIVSHNGAWGYSGQFDGNSFLGGSYSFIKNIRESIPEIDEEFYNFLADGKNSYSGSDISWILTLLNFLTGWKAMNYGSDNDWLTKILIRIYGEERANELFEELKKMGIYFSTF